MCVGVSLQLESITTAAAMEAKIVILICDIYYAPKDIAALMGFYGVNPLCCLQTPQTAGDSDVLNPSLKQGDYKATYSNDTFKSGKSDDQRYQEISTNSHVS
jgi:hypothetical protein